MLKKKKKAAPVSVHVESFLAPFLLADTNETEKEKIVREVCSFHWPFAWLDMFYMWCWLIVLSAVHKLGKTILKSVDHLPYNLNSQIALTYSVSEQSRKQRSPLFNQRKPVFLSYQSPVYNLYCCEFPLQWQLFESITEYWFCNSVFSVVSNPNY